MNDATTTPNSDQAFSRVQAAAYLGISVRKLAYLMKARTVEFEKHGKKTIFRRSHLDAYRAKCVIKTKGD